MAAKFWFPRWLVRPHKKGSIDMSRKSPWTWPLTLSCLVKSLSLSPLSGFQSRYYWYISFSTLVRRQSSFKVQSLLSNHIIPTKIIRYDNLFYPLPQAVLQAIKSSRLFECMKINPWRNCLWICISAYSFIQGVSKGGIFVIDNIPQSILFCFYPGSFTQ